jgi:hopene-associated glycosyltransferase HpnB
MLIGLACLPVLLWLYLLFGRGGFWRVSIERRAASSFSQCVIAVIPARNEAAVIGAAVRSLGTQVARIIVVDDNSSDDTAQIARSLGAFVLRGRALPAGWTGKLWALAQGVEYAESLAPDYLLLTDADIEHGSKSVAELVATAKARKLDLASYMVKLACATTAEKALIPAFVFFFLKLYPPKWIASKRRRTAGAAGGCILIRPDALREIGGIGAIRNEVIDDCALARAIKHNGGRIWMGLTDDTQSIRSYGSFSEIGRMISRTAFNQLHHSTLLLAAAVLALFFTYVLPPLLVLTGRPLLAILALAAWLMMSAAYLPMVRFYRVRAVWSLALPLIAVFYMGATLASAIQYWRGRGGQWKGRLQDARAD